MTVADGFIIHNVTGIRAHIVSRMDGKGYDVTKRELFLNALSPFLFLTSCEVGPFGVKTGQIVYINDSRLLLATVDGETPIKSNTQKRLRIPEIELRVYMDYLDPLFHIQAGVHDMTTEASVLASTAMFGGDPAASNLPAGPIRFGHGEGVRLVRDSANPYGCLPYVRQFDGEAIVLSRGECTFLEKLTEAALAGASGVIAINDENHGVNPSGDPEELDAVGTSLDDVAIVVVNSQDGRLITSMLDSAEIRGLGQVMMAIAQIGEPGMENTNELERTKARDGNRVLYLNGHPLVNTRLMV